MDDFVQSVFLGEIDTQCRFIIDANADLDAALDRVPGDHRAALTDIWRHLQTILVSSANLYKMLWGSGAKRAAQRAPLRDLLGVADHSILRNPSIRNDFEHFDERLEDWYTFSPHRIYMGRNIGSPFMISGAEGEKKFSHYDPWMGVVSFWENEVSIRDLVAEATRLRELLVQRLPRAEASDTS